MPKRIIEEYQKYKCTHCGVESFDSDIDVDINLMRFCPKCGFVECFEEIEGVFERTVENYSREEVLNILKDFRHEYLVPVSDDELNKFVDNIKAEIR